MSRSAIQAGGKPRPRGRATALAPRSEGHRAPSGGRIEQGRVSTRARRTLRRRSPARRAPPRCEPEDRHSTSVQARPRAGREAGGRRGSPQPRSARTTPRRVVPPRGARPWAPARPPRSRRDGCLWPERVAPFHSRRSQGLDTVCSCATLQQRRCQRVSARNHVGERAPLERIGVNRPPVRQVVSGSAAARRP